MKKLSFLLFLLILQNSICQTSKDDFMMDIKPIWSHLSFDSAFVNHPKYWGFDGYNQYIFSNVVPSILFKNSYYNVLINGTEFLNGAKLEKIDMKTGKQVWTSTFDLTNSTKREYPVLSYINSNSQLELICFRDNEDSTWIFPFWIRSKLVRRVYDINSGQLIEHKIGSNLLFNLGFTYIYPNFSNHSTTPYTYVACGGQKQDFSTPIHGYNSSLELVTADTFLSPRTLEYFDAFGYFRFNGRYDTLVSLKRTNSIKPWNPSSLYNIKVELYNNNIELLKTYDFTDKLENMRNYEMSIPINGRYNFILSNNGELYIPTPIIINSFDYDGRLREKIKLDTVFSPVLTNYQVNKLRYQDGLLIVRNIFNSDLSSSIEFLQTDGKGNIIHRKTSKMRDDLFLSFFNIYELEDGNFVLNASLRSREKKEKFSEKNGRSIVCLLNKEDIIDTHVGNKDIENKLESQIKFQDYDHLFIESKDVKYLFLFNSSGQRLNPNFVLSTDNSISLTTSNLISGIYYLQILHSNGQSEIVKFLK
ncbi:MAG: hypothetical protein K1X49_09635 [Saprospiraceae bacterium]|nr:hypothetical protein [Saprospiraceae bacterium]